MLFRSCPGKEEGLQIEFNHMTNDLIRHTFIMKTGKKISMDIEVQRRFLVGEHIKILVLSDST